MSSRVVYGLLVSTLGLLPLSGNRPEFARIIPSSRMHPAESASRPATGSVPYSKSLRFNVYTFTVTAADSGASGELTVKAHRGALLLTNFRVRVNGAVVNAEVADLDNNRLPELYVYSISTGSGSFGHVYAWQFLPERKATIVPVNWRLLTDEGYMGHDSLWVGRDVLCRRYPVFQSGNGNSEPTGGVRVVRYRLKSIGEAYALVAEPE